MIFVTVGTHEQPFDRLIMKVDELVKTGQLNEPVFIQTGYSKYIPKYADFKKFITYDEMSEFINKASVIITHGGPATFMSVLASGKKPIVVPRQVKFNEHINDHQLEFVQQVVEKGYEIDVVTDIKELRDTVSDNISKTTSFIPKSHNDEFVKKFTKIVEKLVINNKKAAK